MLNWPSSQWSQLQKLTQRQCAQSASAHCIIRKACKCRFTITVIALSVLCAIHKEHSLKLFQPNVLPVTRCSLFIIHWIQVFICKIKHLHHLNICSRVTLTHTPVYWRPRFELSPYGKWQVVTLCYNETISQEKCRRTHGHLHYINSVINIDFGLMRSSYINSIESAELMNKIALNIVAKYIMITNTSSNRQLCIETN